MAQYGGLDHTYALSTGGDVDQIACTLQHQGSGRRVDVGTTKPGLHIYTGSHLTNDPWAPNTGIALETQYWPDSPNRPSFPSAFLRPGEPYQHTTTFTFTAAQNRGSG